MRAVSWILCAALAVMLGVMASGAAYAQAPSPAPTADVTVKNLPPVSTPQSTIAFDADKATNAYLAQISGEARAKSDSYFEGGYWLLLWDAVYAVLVSALLLWFKISARMRNIAVGITRSRFWQVPIYIVLYTILTTILTFPMAVYEGFFREHQYGLSNQNFVQWLGDFGILNGVDLLAFTILGTLVYAAIRGAKERWWVWGTVISLVFFMFLAVIAPVFLSPMLNHYQPLKEGPIKEKILSLARSEGIPATNVYEFDASRQTKRVSANVSGFMGTTRISLNDNLLNRSSEREIYAVLGHEMGHYALNHTVWLLMLTGLVILLGFAFAAWSFNVLTRIFGGNWDVRTVDDPAGLPVLLGIATVFFFVMTPVQNTIVRTAEAQADLFGVNAAREPDGFAMAALKLSEYRKLDPSPLEEFVFYDHPSGRSRISMMMRWKAEHLNDADIKAGPVSPQ